MDLLKHFDFSAIDEYLKSISEHFISFENLVNIIISGDVDFVFKKILMICYEIFLKEVSDSFVAGKKIIVVGLISGLFMLMANAFNSSYIKTLGGYISYIEVATLILIFYKNAYCIGLDMMTNIRDFVMILTPTLFLSISMCNATFISISYYNMINICLEVINSIFIYMILPIINIFVLSSVATNALNFNKLSYITKLLNKCIRTIIKVCISVISGISIIKAMILPLANSMSENVAVKTLKSIPGIKDGAGVVFDVVLGSAKLIKSSIGVCALICIILIIIAPVIKLFVISIFIKCITTIIIAISDVKIVNLCNAVDEGISLIIKVTFASLEILFISLAVICISINC